MMWLLTRCCAPVLNCRVICCTVARLRDVTMLQCELVIEDILIPTLLSTAVGPGMDDFTSIDVLTVQA